MPANLITKTDTNKQTFPKINQAIQDSFDAINKATRADQNSNSALVKAKYAENTANSIRTEFNAVVNRETDSDAMSRQASINTKGIDKINLKERLDEDYYDLTNQITAKGEYIDTKFMKEVAPINGLTLQNVNIYVDASKGSDENDGTEQRPFKTIQKAVDSIPKIINRDRFIYIADGLYDEEVVVKSISGAAIVLTRYGGLTDVTTGAQPGIRIKSIVFYDIGGLCRVENFDSYQANLINGVGFVRFSRCGYGTVNSCRAADSNISKPTFIWDGTPGSINSSYMNDQQICVQVLNGSVVRVDSSNQHGPDPSNVALSVQAGDIKVNGTASWIHQASVPEQSLQGGRIRRQLANAIELTLLRGWTAYPGGNYVPRIIKDESGMVHLQGVIQGGNPGQGVAAIQLPEGYRPLYNNHVFGAFSNDNTQAKIVIDVEGILAVERNNGSYVSLSGISYYAGW